MREVVMVILTGAVRHGLQLVAGWLIANGILAPEQDFSGDEKLIAGIVISLASFGYMAWVKVKEKRLSNTKAALPAGSTEQEAKAVIKDGFWASAMTPADMPPVITNNKPGDVK